MTRFIGISWAFSGCFQASQQFKDNSMFHWTGDFAGFPFTISRSVLRSLAHRRADAAQSRGARRADPARKGKVADLVPSS
jgi:hypothetical protein